MKPLRTTAIVLCITFWSLAFANAQEMDTVLSNLATNLASTIKAQAKTKVAVIDFTDLDGGSSELGKYIAEELTVDLVMVRHDFSVLDRANLRKILAEHKLTATGLVDPDSAKKLGQFAGVDAIILGTITPKKQSMGLTVKVITTDTAEIVGATKTQFTPDENVQQLASKAADSSDALADDKPKVTKTLDDLRVELTSLKIVDGGALLLSMNLVNTNKDKSIFVAINADTMNNPRVVVQDEGGNQFGSGPYDRGVSGVPSIMYSQYGYQGPGFSKAVEIRPGEPAPATIKFFPVKRRPAQPGVCTVQMEFIISHNFSNGFGQGSVNTFSAKIKAE